jgi:anti-anti-sigma factor
MPHSDRAVVVLTPRQPLVAGGAAAEFEASVKRLLGQGCRLLIADLDAVTRIDSAGIRALVRAHTSAGRVGGAFRIARPTANTRELLTLARLDAVLNVYDSVAQAKLQPFEWRTFLLLLLGALACTAIAAVGLGWRVDAPSGGAASNPFTGVAGDGMGVPVLPWGYPIAELLQLLSAGIIALFVTFVQKLQQRDQPLTRSMEQAQVLLCVSGALIMIIIGNSVARAFGIAGAASIIRFRTPVDDPKDVTVLFLLMGLGMACGVGLLPIAALGGLFLAVAIVVLDHIVAVKPRVMLVEMTASSPEFPLSHVVSVFARFGVTWEPREFTQGTAAVMTYQTSLPPHVSIDEVTEALVAGGAHGLTSVSWEPPKRSL